jgi:CheY-like chemotaxis protein
VSPQAARRRSPQPLRILLVEDNDDDVVMLLEAFAGVPLVHLDTVRDGEEAMAYLRRQGRYKDIHQPGLLLLDIRMPKKDGFGVLREMKADPALRHVPVIVLTTSSREEDILRSYAEGACSYLEKPVGLTRSRNMVQQLALYWTELARVPTA